MVVSACHGTWILFQSRSHEDRGRLKKFVKNSLGRITMNNFLAQERTHFIYKAQSVSCESVRSRTKVNILYALFKFFIYRLFIDRIFNDLRGPFGKLEPGSVSFQTKSRNKSDNE